MHKKIKIKKTKNKIKKYQKRFLKKKKIDKKSLTWVGVVVRVPLAILYGGRRTVDPFTISLYYLFFHLKKSIKSWKLKIWQRTMRNKYVECP